VGHSESISERCRNCGKGGGEAVRQDWSGRCPDCGQLLWLREGDVLECRVANFVTYGVFVELGDGLHGFIHRNDLAAQPIDDPREAVQLGQMLRAEVTHIDLPRERISLSRKRHPAAGHS
jgi:transcriptional accessory protein Tex/SPT6